MFSYLTGCLIGLLALENVLAAYNNSHIIDVLEEIDTIKHPRVIDAMIHVDRGHFCAHNDSRKYMLAARDIGYGSIIDNPVQHAEVLELLKDKLVPGAKVLDVGSGSGYLTTCFAHMVGKNGSVVGVEHIPEIVAHASNVTTLHYPKLNKRIKFICGDGRLGYPEGGPYDVIHVGASSEVVPKALHNQLKPFGLLYMTAIENQDDETRELWNHTVYECQPDGRWHKEVDRPGSMVQWEHQLRNYSEQVHSWWHTTTTEWPFADRHDGDWVLENSNPFYPDRTIHCHYVDQKKLTLHSYEHSDISELKTYETRDTYETPEDKK
uniref:protein-L-isoaspartate(D-aspartate) O-methyltransferase n=2 Tax=Cacopsylla melanoneura TaxID=428564 RepID=A0A8D9BF70_9HEMI